MDKNPSAKSFREWRGLPIGLAAAAFALSLVTALFFGQGIGFALIFALFALALTVFFIVMPLQRKAEKTVELFRQHGGTAEERRAAAAKQMAAVKDEYTWGNVFNTAGDFWSKVAIALVYMAGYAWIMYTYFGVLPEGAFGGMPLWLLAVTWLILLLFMGRVMLIVFLLALTGIMAVVSVMGPTILLQFLPYFFTMPLLMIMNFGIMFGPLTITNLMQIKVKLPFQGKDSTKLADVRGQGDLIKQLVRTLNIFLSDEENVLYREKGIMMYGPPGTGKTLSARGMANELRCPIVITTGSAFTATFVGIPIIIMMYYFWLLERLAKQHGRCIGFMDEIDQLARRRGGVEEGRSRRWGGSFYELLPHNRFGMMGDMVIDDPEMHAIAEWYRSPAPKLPEYDPVFITGDMGMGMGNMALPVFLAKLDGVPTPPMLESLWRGKVNQLLDVFFIPPSITVKGKKISLRVPPAKAYEPKILHIGATNVPGLLDPALIRPGRFGLQLHFRIPTSPEERFDVASLYFDQLATAHLLCPEMLDPERQMDFARNAVGLSPAEIMQAITQAPTLQSAFISRLRDIARAKAAGEKLDPSDERFWKRHGTDYGQPDWDKGWATWASLMESLRTIQFGLAQPQNISDRMRQVVAAHEMGHLLAAAGFYGDSNKADVITIMPREGNLGMVSWRPIEQLDPQQQWVWEARLRVAVASVATERIFFGDHRPGVSGDLMSLTRVAAGMNDLGFAPRDYSEDERARHVEYGKQLVTSSGAPMGIPGMVDPTAAIMAVKRDAVLQTIGAAYVDAYRLVLKNRNLMAPVIGRLLEQDEISGHEMDVLWEQLQRDIRPLTDADTEVWPPIATKNPFYAKGETEVTS